MNSMFIEQVQPADTPADMRAEIFRLQYYDSLVREVMDAANYSGMSAEDRYTVLAYHALKAKNIAQAQVFEFVCVSPSPRVIVAELAPGDKGKIG